MNTQLAQPEFTVRIVERAGPPSNYKPTSPSMFIGATRQKADLIERLVESAAENGEPIKLLILGEPGIGKTALANFAMHKLGCDRFHAHQYNGTQLKIENVEDLARSFHYKDLFAAYRLLRIEEVDKVPTVAQVRLLTLLDDLPDQCAVICTSNCKVAQLEERFASRFIVIQVQPPNSSDIRQLLSTHWPSIGAAEIARIATFACGNVRQALLEAQLTLCQ